MTGPPIHPPVGSQTIQDDTNSRENQTKSEGVHNTTRAQTASALWLLLEEPLLLLLVKTREPTSTRQGSDGSTVASPFTKMLARF